MTSINLPFLENGELISEEMDLIFDRPENLPLVVWSSRLPQNKKEQMKMFCELNNFPHDEIRSGSVKQMDKQMEEAWERYKTNSIMIIGDYLEFPPMKFKTRYGVHYSDFVYADVGNEGSADVGIGRVFGSISTIVDHLIMSIGDSNEAFLFETDPNRSSATIEAVKALGFDLTIVGKYEESYKSKLENAELIMQVSDGLITETIHGSPLKWVSKSGKIMDYKDFSGLKFKNYPLIFSESCSTASFGPLLSNAIRAGAMYYGATSPSANNPKEYSNWRACAFADGVKIGMLDIMDEVQTIGQVIREVDRVLYQSLSKSQQDTLRKAMKNADKGIEIPNMEVQTLLQFNLFGNPERPVVVGIEPDFDSGIIHYDT